MAKRLIYKGCRKLAVGVRIDLSFDYSVDRPTIIFMIFGVASQPHLKIESHNSLSVDCAVD